MVGTVHSARANDHINSLSEYNHGTLGANVNTDLSHIASMSILTASLPPTPHSHQRSDFGWDSSVHMAAPSAFDRESLPRRSDAHDAPRQNIALPPIRHIFSQLEAAAAAGSSSSSSNSSSSSSSATTASSSASSSSSTAAASSTSSVQHPRSLSLHHAPAIGLPPPSTARKVSPAAPSINTSASVGTPEYVHSPTSAYPPQRAAAPYANHDDRERYAPASNSSYVPRVYSTPRLDSRRPDSAQMHYGSTSNAASGRHFQHSPSMSPTASSGSSPIGRHSGPVSQQPMRQSYDPYELPPPSYSRHNGGGSSTAPDHQMRLPPPPSSSGPAAFHQQNSSRTLSLSMSSLHGYERATLPPASTPSPASSTPANYHIHSRQHGMPMQQQLPPIPQHSTHHGVHYERYQQQRDYLSPAGDFRGHIRSNSGGVYDQRVGVSGMVIDGPSQAPVEPRQRRRRGNLPKETTDKLRAWFHGNLHHPYPTEDEKQELMRQTGLHMNQISNWFINARRRHLPALTNNMRLESNALARRRNSAGTIVPGIVEPSHHSHRSVSPHPHGVVHGAHSAQSAHSGAVLHTTERPPLPMHTPPQSMQAMPTHHLCGTRPIQSASHNASPVSDDDFGSYSRRTLVRGGSV